MFAESEATYHPRPLRPSLGTGCLAGDRDGVVVRPGGDGGGVAASFVGDHGDDDARQDEEGMCSVKDVLDEAGAKGPGQNSAD